MVVHCVRPLKRECGIEHRQLDPAAAAGTAAREQGGGDRLRGGQAGELVGQQGRDQRRVLGLAFAVRRTHARDRLDHRVIHPAISIRAGLTETGDRQIDQHRIEGGQGFGAETEPVHRTRPEVFDQHIGAANQVGEHLAGGGLLEVEHDRALAAIGGDESGRHLALGRTDTPAQVATRGLDFDHFGALVGHDRGSDRAGDHG